MSGADLMLALVAGSCVLAAIWCVRTTFPLRARVDQLELERPRFIREMEGLVEEAKEQMERADAKRKRAENALRANGAPPPETVQPPLQFRRGSFIEPL
jgi:hypothetical protein